MAGGNLGRQMGWLGGGWETKGIGDEPRAVVEV